MSSSIADRTDAVVELVSEFIIEDNVERSVLGEVIGDGSLDVIGGDGIAWSSYGSAGGGGRAMGIGRTMTEATAIAVRRSTQRG